MSIEKLDIVTLDDNKEYAVVEKIVFNNNEYVLLNEVDKEENLLNHSIIMKVILSNGSVYFDYIKTEEELTAVSKQLENL